MATAQTALDAPAPVSLAGSETPAATEDIQNTSAAVNYASLKAAVTPAKPFAPYSGGTGGSTKNLCGGINLGLANTMATFGSTSTSGTGFNFHLSLGIAFQNDGKGDGSQHAFTIEARYGSASSHLKYNDALGKEQKKDYQFSWIGLPVSYTGVKAGRGNTGFYYQAGINFEYLVGAVDNSTDVSKDMNKLQFVPYVSAGISFDREGHGPFKDEKDMIGPFISYTANNMSSVSNFKLSCLIIGLRIWAWQID